MSSQRNVEKLERVQNLFTEIKAEIDKEDEDPEYQKIVAYCDKILAETPKDVDALKCKATAFLNMSKFDETVIFLRRYAKLTSKFSFLLSYALYRSNKLNDALHILKKYKDTSVPATHLKAQILYKMEQFAKCTETYECGFDVQQLTEDDSELKVNICASYAASGPHSKAVESFGDLKDSDDTSYELSYNLACAVIEDGDLEEAAQLLEKAKRMCETSLQEEGYDQEEIENESSAIVVQQAYLAHLQGSVTEAEKVYKNILNSEVDDHNAINTATNNLLCAIRNKNPDQKSSDAMKKINKLLSKENATKLSPRQRMAIEMNKLLLLMYTRQHGTVEQLSKAFAKSYGQTVFPILVLSALNFRDKKFDAAIDILKSRTSEHPDDLQPSLALTHTYINAGKINDAIEVLKSLKVIEHKPALVATLVTLYEKQNDSKSALATLEAAVAHWKSYMGDDSDASSHRICLMKQCAKYKLMRGDNAGAFADYKELVEYIPNDVSLLGQAITAGVGTAPDEARMMAQELPPLDTDEVDVDALEELPPPGAKNVFRKKKGDHKLTVEEMQQIAIKKREKRKRKRKKRYPKDFDPEKPGGKPDPDRWLPRWKRVKSKKKGRRWKNQQFRGGQGGDLEGAAQLEIHLTDASEEPDEPEPEPQPQKKRQQKKKKGKGRRRR